MVERERQEGAEKDGETDKEKERGKKEKEREWKRERERKQRRKKRKKGGIGRDKEQRPSTMKGVVLKIPSGPRSKTRSDMGTPTGSDGISR